MIITCEQCHTQFQLDDERIPDQGAKVRCSRCRHAFFVEKELAPVGDAVESAVGRALDDDSAAGHDELGDTASRDPVLGESASPDEVLGDTQPTDPWRSASAPDGDPGLAAEPDRTPDPDDDSDWEFSHDPDAPAAPADPDGLSGSAGSDSSLAAAQGMLDDLLADTQDDLEPFVDDAGAGALQEAVDSLLDAEPDSAVASADAEPDSAAASADAEPALDEPRADLLADLAEPEPEIDMLSGRDLGAPDEAALPGNGPDLSELDSLEHAESDLGEASPLDDLDEYAVEEEPAAVAAEAQESPAPDALGVPDEWDFFADADASDDSRAQPARSVVGQVPLVPSPTGSRRNSIEVEVEPSQLSVWAARAAHSAGWTAVVGLVLAVLWGAVASPPAGRSSAGSGPVVVGGLDVHGVEGHWVDNAVAGPVFVISGELRNPGSQPLVPGVRLAVRWLGAEGEVIGDQVAAVAPALAASRIREESPRELRAALASAAQEAAGTPLAGGRSVAFQAIAATVPERAARFDLQAIPVDEPTPVPDAPPGDAGEPSRGT